MKKIIAMIAIITALCSIGYTLGKMPWYWVAKGKNL